MPVALILAENVRGSESMGSAHPTRTENIRPL
jgi:hypothetical protein